MSSYRSAYENYYKNINNTEKRKVDKSRYSIFGKKTEISNRPLYNTSANNNLKNVLIKRVISELTGATILLFFFVALKYIPSSEAREIHNKCKQALSYNFNYDECIDAFNTIEVGNVKGKDLRIGNITTDDLKIENLKAKASNFIEYLRSNSNKDMEE